MLSLLTRWASNEGEGWLWRTRPCQEVYVSAWTRALLQSSGQRSQTASARARELWETGGSMGGLQRPSRDLTFLSDNLMNSGTRSWPFEEVITQLVKKKTALDRAVHLYTRQKRRGGAPWDGCHNREDAFQRVIYSPEILKECLLDHGEEWKLLKSRMP